MKYRLLGIIASLILGILIGALSTLYYARDALMEKGCHDSYNYVGQLKQVLDQLDPEHAKSISITKSWLHNQLGTLKLCAKRYETKLEYNPYFIEIEWIQEVIGEDI